MAKKKIPKKPTKIMAGGSIENKDPKTRQRARKGRTLKRNAVFPKRDGITHKRQAVLPGRNSDLCKRNVGFSYKWTLSDKEKGSLTPDKWLQYRKQKKRESALKGWATRRSKAAERHKKMIGDMQLLTPTYYKDLVEKYGEEGPMTQFIKEQLKDPPVKVKPNWKLIAMELIKLL